jgi:hypothetical protein
MEGNRAVWETRQRKDLNMKKLLSTILLLLLVLAMIFTLAACTAPAVVTADGGDTVAGAAIKVALNVIEALALSAVSIFGAWWAAKAKNKTELQNINIAMRNVETVVRQTVGELKQTVVDSMKDAADNGKLTESQVDDLKRRLLTMTLGKLDSPTVNLLEAAGMDLCAFITGAAESWIAEQKEAQNAFILDGVEITD